MVILRAAYYSEHNIFNIFLCHYNNKAMLCYCASFFYSSSFFLKILFVQTYFMYEYRFPLSIVEDSSQCSNSNIVGTMFTPSGQL